MFIKWQKNFPQEFTENKKAHFLTIKTEHDEKRKKIKGRKGPLSKSEIDIYPAPDSVLNSRLKHEKDLIQL